MRALRGNFVAHALHLMSLLKNIVSFFFPYNAAGPLTALRGFGDG